MQLLPLLWKRIPNGAMKKTVIKSVGNNRLCFTISVAYFAEFEFECGPLSIYLQALDWKIAYLQWQIQDFPEIAVPIQKVNVKSYYDAINFSKKMHENERICTGGGGGSAALALPLDRAMIYTYFLERNSDQSVAVSKSARVCTLVQYRFTYRHRSANSIKKPKDSQKYMMHRGFSA